jgi:hypothetical protein
VDKREKLDGMSYNWKGRHTGNACKVILVKGKVVCIMHYSE